MRTGKSIFFALALTTACTSEPTNSALAWGDEGHETIALVAGHFLTAEAKEKVNAFFAADSLNALAAHDVASESIWADKYREHGGAPKTSQWHYVDIEVAKVMSPQRASIFRSFLRVNLPRTAPRGIASSTRSTNSRLSLPILPHQQRRKCLR